MRANARVSLRGSQLYQTAAGLIPDRDTDSKNKNSTSGTRTNSGNTFKALKDFAGVSIRMLDKPCTLDRNLQTI